LLVTASPICALALAVFIPATSPLFRLILSVSIVAAAVLLAARFVGAASSVPMHTPRAW